MTWLGKILTILVLVVSLVWVYMTALAWSTRTNWKTSADKYRAALDESEKLRKQENEDAQKQIAALNAQLAETRKGADTSAGRTELLAQTNEQTLKDYSAIFGTLEMHGTSATAIAANQKAAQEELTAVRARNKELEDETAKRAIELQKALNDKSSAEADARTVRLRLDEAQGKIDNLTAQMNELRRQGPGFGGSAEPQFGSPPVAPLLAGTRGTVTAFDRESGLVQISIGLDAGVSPGAVLDVSRLEGGGKYLGTVYVTDARPKAAVATFRPLSGKRINLLKPDELPKAGDMVEKPAMRTAG
jgi:hypothetical protein